MKIFSALIISFLICNSLKSQTTVYLGYEKLQNKAEITSGEEVLYKTLLSDLNFPDNMVFIPQVTIMIGCIEVLPNGTLNRVFSLNAIDNLLLAEFESVVRKSPVTWRENRDTSYLVIPIEFRTTPIEAYVTDYGFIPDYFESPIVCLGGYDLEIASDSDLINRYEDLMQKRKLGKALKVLEVIINRKPFKEVYYVKKIRLLTYLGEIDEAQKEEKKVGLLFR